MSNCTFRHALLANFLGNAPDWYKYTILFFLALNPVLLYLFGPVVTGWMLIVEFIFTLAMALKCYPLQPGGLLAIEAVFIGLTSAETVLHEVIGAINVLLLLIFMVAGIYFMKNLLLFAFTKILLGVRSKILLSFLFCIISAVLSAFLDALTVTAVIVSVSVGFYGVYHKIASGKKFHHDDHDHDDDNQIHDDFQNDLEQFRGFLRNLLMHAAIGTALGGVCTLVGEPQNLLIASKANWHFMEFFYRMTPITMPVLVTGLACCVLLELKGWFGYGVKLPEEVRVVLVAFDEEEDKKRNTRKKAELIIQALTGVWLVIALTLHLAEVGLIGLSVIIFITAFNGIIDEHQIGKSFMEALPFAALLTVFFAIVAVIADQQLFSPVIKAVLALEGNTQVAMFYLANGVLSMVSDNVFVATIYINEVKQALVQGQITQDAFNLLAVAINTGTNIPSVATPNGQAAFLFLLTSSIAPLVRLSYGRMVWMALPYTISMSLVGLLSVYLFLQPVTEMYYEKGVLQKHSSTEKVIEKSHH
ncbi:MAG: sodium/proton antiporter NhaB [Methylococcales bacterium]|jgi:Na+:H+ antiporter, NhaB family|nr:sodium/proton antiporter NhaB [Methylococcales bacterium]MBT7408437.1 sodium/proton antiporter NhaB [Methylococcales bacterium]